MPIKSKAIVLKCFRYGESSLIADLFTEGEGHVPMIFSTGRTKSKRSQQQLLRPLSVVEAVYQPSSHGGLARLSSLSSAMPMRSIPFDEAKLSQSLFLAELLSKALRGEPANAPLFAYMLASVEWLDNASEGYFSFHLVFLMRLTRFLGFYPNLSDESPYFDLRNACFSPVIPPHHEYLSADESAKVKLLMRMDYETMHLFKINKEERNRCVEVLLEYYRLHLPDFPEMKSFEILRQLSQ